ncbi:putative ATP-dependent RNA helicase DDX28 [Ciona intestinalis]
MGTLTCGLMSFIRLPMINIYRRIETTRFIPVLSGQVHNNKNEHVNKEDVPIIRFPVALKRKINRRNIKQQKRSKKGVSLLKLAKPGKLLISSSDKDTSMYTNEFITKFQPPVLSSSTWTSHRSPGRSFKIHSNMENPSFKEEFSSFNDILLDTEILQALRINGVDRPTVIQAKSIPSILKGNNVMFAAETGSGKTFAYLLPIIHKLMRSRAEGGGDQVFVSPKALILTPTKELSQQVMRMALSLKLPIQVASTESIGKTDFNVDLMVSTPVPLINSLKQRKFELGNIEFVVLDECDTLLDDSFANKMQHILSRFNITSGKKSPILSPQSAQLILCSATFPSYASDALDDIISMEEIDCIKSGYLHRVSPHVTHNFMRVKPSEKISEMVAVLNKPDRGPVMVFCNTRHSVRQVIKGLHENGIAALSVNGSMHTKDRYSTLQQFQAGTDDVLVSTDIASRGLDTKQVKHVINYEVPSNVSDYIHRCGRVGRVGQTHVGVVTSLVSRKWEVPVVMKIEEAARRRDVISGVSANIKEAHEHRWAQAKLQQDIAEEIHDTY